MINVFTFAIYGIDKSAARKGKWRIRERHLQLLSLLGGWWGALIAQQFLRHKSIKTRFLVFFSIMLMTNICVVTSLINKGLL